MVESAEMPELLAQIIYNGNTTASLPSGPVPHNVRVTCTPNHWATTETMEWLDSKMNPHGEQTPWVLVLDVAPVHVSTEFRRMCEEVFPWVKRVYIPPNLTHKLQPLDRAYMFSFKKALAKETSRHFARQIIGSLQEDITFKLNTSLVALKPLLCMWTSATLMELSERQRLRESAWQLMKPGEQEESILRSARKPFGEGTLFRSARANASSVPELEPDEHEPMVEEEGDPTVEPRGHDELGLLDEAFDDQAAAEEVLCDPEPEEEDEIVEACVTDPNQMYAEEPPRTEEEPLSTAAPSRTDSSMLARVTALRLIFGRGPARLASFDPRATKHIWLNSVCCGFVVCCPFAVWLCCYVFCAAALLLRCSCIVVALWLHCGQACQGTTTTHL